MRLVRVLVALAAVGAISAVLAGNATAVTRQANHDLIPGGVSKTNAKAAWSKINSRAFVDPSMRQALASTANVTSYNPSDYRVVGYGRASAGTANSAVLSNGAVVPASDSPRCHVGAQVLIVINKVTGAKLEVCTACGNPRLRRVVQRIPKRPWALGTVIRFQRHVVKAIQPLTCPSGDKVTGSLDVWVKGIVRARTWGQVQGAMNAKQRLQVNLAIKAQVKLRCKAAPPVVPPVVVPPKAPPPVVLVTATATATATASASCPDGTTATASGSGSASASAVTYAEAYALAYAKALVLAQANASASVVCGSSPPPVTPPPPSHFTEVTCTGFEEISGGASMLIKCDVSNDNGAPISLSVNSNDTNSRVSGINCITNGGSASCPGNGTFEFRVSGINDGTTVLYSSVTAVASANGITATYNSGQFPVDPSGGGF